MTKLYTKSLKRIVGVGFGVAMVVGGSIGVGILRMPATIAGYTTNPILFILFWVLGGLIALTGATIYAELGTRLPIAGGPFVFAQKAFGNAGGYITGCSDWLFYTSAISYLSIAIAEYLNGLLKWELPLGFSSSLIILFFVAIQWQGLKSSSNFQKVLSMMNAIFLFFFVIACFTYFLKEDPYSGVIVPDSTSYLPLISIFVLSMRAVFITFTGWNAAVYFNEEDTNPQTNLPRSLIFGVISVTIIYIFINLGLIAVLPLHVMGQSNLPAADAAQLMFGGSGRTVVTLISIVSLTTCLAATLLIAPRILFAISRAGLFFKPIATLNKNSIPGNALIMTAGASIIFSSTGLFNVVVSMGALFALIADLSVYTSIIFIRKQEPLVIPPFKAWVYPFSAIFMVLITLTLIVGLLVADTLNSLYVLATLACAFTFYVLFKNRTRNHNAER